MMKYSGTIFNRDFRDDCGYRFNGVKTLTVSSVSSSVINSKDPKQKKKVEGEVEGEVEGFVMREKIFVAPFQDIQKVFKNLTHADLQYCGIQSWDGLFLLKNLIFLRLNNNEIKSIVVGSLPENLKYLYLRSNKIELIDNEAKLSLSNYERVDMRNNTRINFDFTGLWKEQFIKAMDDCTGPRPEEESTNALLKKIDAKLDRLLLLAEPKE